jgi:hypothetical protein
VQYADAVDGHSQEVQAYKMLESGSKLFKIIISAIIAVGGSWLVYELVIMPLSHIMIMRTVQLGITVIAAGILYLAALKLFKIDELETIKEIILRR